MKEDRQVAEVCVGVYTYMWVENIKGREGERAGWCAGDDGSVTKRDERRMAARVKEEEG